MLSPWKPSATTTPTTTKVSATSRPIHYKKVSTVNNFSMDWQFSIHVYSRPANGYNVRRTVDTETSLYEHSTVNKITDFDFLHNLYDKHTGETCCKEHESVKKNNQQR